MTDCVTHTPEQAMKPWNFQPPPPSDLGDHEVRLEGTHLDGKRIALLVTGGIAAMKAPMVARALRRQGAIVTAFLSDEGRRYVTEETMSWACDRAAVTALTPRAEHLSDAERFDLFLVAPATYNTIGKMACGIADGLVSATMASAIGRMERGECAVLVAPTMHGSMHNSILTDNMRRLEKAGVGFIPPRMDAGKLNLPDEPVIVAWACRALSRSAIRGRRIVVTGGPVPVALDGVRTISNRFTGSLAIEIAMECEWRGADAHLVLGAGSTAPPAWLSSEIVGSLNHYRARVLTLATEAPCDACVLSAAAADFAPTIVRDGKVKSSGDWTITLQPTHKVIDAVRERAPAITLIGFKYEEGLSTEALLKIGQERAERDGFCVATRGEDCATLLNIAECTPKALSDVHAEGEARQAEQVSWICRRGAAPERVAGKRAIARAIVDAIESSLTPVRSATPAPTSAPHR